MSVPRNSSHTTMNVEDDNHEPENVPEKSADDIIRHYKRLMEEVQHQMASFSISNEVLNKLVAEIMRHMIFKNQSHPGVPVRREELISIVHGQGYGDRRSLTAYVIINAQAKFPRLFGFEMKEIKKLRRIKANTLSSQNENVGSKEYVLRNIYPQNILKTFVDKVGLMKIGLSAIVVLLIKSNRGNIEEDKLFDLLSRLSISMDEIHPEFGKIEDVLKKLESQRFIQKRIELVNTIETNVYSLSVLSIENEAKLTNLMNKLAGNDEDVLLSNS